MLLVAAILIAVASAGQIKKRSHVGKEEQEKDKEGFALADKRKSKPSGESNEGDDGPQTLTRAAKKSSKTSSNSNRTAKKGKTMKSLGEVEQASEDGNENGEGEVSMPIGNDELFESESNQDSNSGQLFNTFFGNPVGRKPESSTRTGHIGFYVLLFEVLKKIAELLGKYLMRISNNSDY